MRGGSLFIDVLRVRELISGVTLDLDLSPNMTVAALKDKLHEVQNVNRACVSVVAGCEVLADRTVVQVKQDA
jgi:hypothetical protein